MSGPEVEILMIFASSVHPRTDRRWLETENRLIFTSSAYARTIELA